MANYDLCITATNGGGFNPVFLVKSSNGTPTTPVTITQVSANAYSTGFPCGSSIGTITKSTPIVFTPSSLQLSITPTSISGSWTFGNYVTITNLVINGTPVLSSGSIITNGPDTVTVYYVECKEQNSYNCPITPDPSQTATETKTPTPTLTPSFSCTPSNTKTPTLTPTQTKTPSVTPIICGIGVTTGSYFYVDCCGNEKSGISVGETVTLNYLYPFTTGINKLNTVTSVSCPTPSSTRTPTVTPTSTITPTISATPKATNFPTPSITRTPSPTPVYEPKNECEPFTLFDLGISCNVIQQPSSNQNNGILGIDITGGTSPYQIYWNGVLGEQTKYNLGYGLYQIKVIDYYGDYTANTICSLIQPTPSPTITKTQTVTPTASATYSQICLIAVGEQSYGPLQFSFNGTKNGKPYWTSGSYNIVWKTTRWEVVGADLNTPVTFNGGGIFVSETTSVPPLAGWQVNGGTQVYSITVTTGTCPSKIPLRTTVSKQDANCNSTSNCDGSITVAARFGTPPYKYSINNGLNWVNSNIFQALCPNTYTVLTRDFDGTQTSNVVVISSSKSPQTYQLQITSQPALTESSVSPNYSQKITYSKIETVPVLPQGVSVSSILNLQTVEINNGPGFGLANNTITLLKNGVTVNPSSVSSNTQTTTRPNCSPEQQTTITTNYQFVISMVSTDVFQIRSASTLSITNGQIALQTNCVTQLINNVSANLSQSSINGCTCCSLSSDSSIVKINENTVSFVQQQPSTCTTVYFKLNRGTSGCANQTEVQVILYPSPYNKDNLSLGELSSNKYDEIGCSGPPTAFVQDLASTIPQGTPLKVICFSTPWGSTQSFQINYVTIDGITYYDGGEFVKNGNCYTVVFGGCGSVPPPP